MGCSSNSNTITNIVNQNPNVILTSNDINNVFCQDQIVTFTAGGANSYEFIVNGISQGNPSTIDTLNSSNFTIGNYSVTVNGEQNNCFGTASLQVSVNQVPGANIISSDIDNIICQGEMVTYTSSGANLYEFFVNNVSISSPSPINTFSTSSLNNGDIVSVVTSSSNGCSNSSAYAPITVNSNPVISLTSSPQNQQICLNDTVILSATGGSLYEFFVDGVSQGPSSSTNSITINNLGNGNNVYVQGTQTGCSAISNSFNYTVFNNPVVALINNEDSLLCDFESTNLIATGANQYQFLINGIPIGPYSSVDTLASLLANGDIVSVNGQTNGCASISNNTITFTVFNTPIISTVCSDLDTTICLNDSVHFTSTGASEYLFELNGASLQNSTLNTFYLNYLNQNDTLKITGFNGHCSSNSNSYVFTVNSMNLNSSVSPSTLICEGDLVTINASGGDLYEFFVNGISVSNQSSQSDYSSSTLNNLDEITYTAYSNSTSCLQENDDFISISVIATPSFNVLPNTTFCEGDSVRLYSNSGLGNQWLLNGTPILSATDTTYTSYASGDYSLEVLIGGNGEVFSIGQNANGIFGAGNNLNSFSPIKSPYFSNFSSLSSGFDFMTGVDSSGNAYSWGNNSSGQLGDGTFTNSNIPNLIASLSNIKFVSTTSSSCMAITNTGEAYVWGNNSEGQLSTGNTSVINFPYLNTNINNIDTVAAGKNHFILLKNDSTVWSVGNNDFGQLGQGNLVSQNNIQQILPLNNIVKIGTGEYHSFAINSNGKLYVWGNNSSGQLGLNDYNNRLSPALSPLQNIIQAEGGASHSVFLNSNHKAYATGANNFGQLGLGNQGSIISPQEIQINGVRMISISQNTSLFLRNDYSVYGCGNNLENQLNSTSINIINSPSRISEIYGIGSIEASKSSSHFLANNLKICVSPIVTITALTNPIVSINSIGDTLTCTSGSNYQWYFNGSMIPGANSSSFVANGTGNYSVLVTYANGCSNMSSDFFHSMSNLLDFDHINSKVSIYPNPAKDYLQIKINGNDQAFQKILITDIFGRIVRKMNLNEFQNKPISLKKMENGCYNLILIHSKGKLVKRFIKN
ncbi:MAG: T9SS type A sorting domain-containing protein [Crocinitomicaceae bacterium]|nr:T9SS type A sorting domain-containing protein [Crocinitomicaceae bacterium]